MSTVEPRMPLRLKLRWPRAWRTPLGIIGTVIAVAWIIVAFTAQWWVPYPPNAQSLPRLQAPTLVLQCSDDIIAPMQVGQYLERTIPNCRMAVIRNQGHCPHMSAPGPSSDAIDSFLASLGI